MFCRSKSKNAEQALAEELESLPAQSALQLFRGMKTGDWIPVPPSMVNGAELGDQGCIDALFLRYYIDPSDFLHICDGCGA